MSELTVLPAAPKEVEIQTTSEGPVTVINDTEVPVWDFVFEVQLVQPGHVKHDDTGLKKNHIAEFFYPALKDQEEDAFKKELRLMPIKVTVRGRQLFGEYGSDNNELLCYSNNGETPADRVEDPVSLHCGKFNEGATKGPFFTPMCEKAKWDNGKPECSDVFKVAFFDIDNLVPVEIKFKGTQISAYNQLRKAFKEKAAAARFRKQSVADYVVCLSAENEGTFSKLKMDLVQAKDAAPKQYQDLCQYYAENLFTYDVEESLTQDPTAEDLEVNTGAESQAEAPAAPSEEAEGGSFDI